MHILYLPIEIATRELEAKLLLAALAAQTGFKVLIGPYSVVKIAEQAGGGVLLYKDASARMLGTFKKLRGKGVLIAVHDEEGLVHTDDAAYLDTRIRFETIKYVDLFFTWGPHQQSLIESVVCKFKSFTEVVCTGHPRVDLLRFKTEKSVTSHRSHRPKMILINTKLAEANHRDGENGWLKILESHSMIRTEEQRDFRNRQIAYKKRLLHAYQNLIEQLSDKCPNHRIVIRPHPAEDKTTWIHHSEHLSNVEVDWSGSIGTWLEAADIIVHTGCTTGLEGVLLGKSVFSFKPFGHSDFDVPLPDEVSIEVGSVDELVRHVQGITPYKMTASQLTATIERHIANTKGEKFASREMISHLSARKSAMLKTSPLRIFAAISFVRLKSTFRRLVNFRRSSLESDPKYSVTLHDISLLLDKLKSSAPQTLVGEIKLKELLPGTFLLESSSSRT